ncbi:probable E3 ubiquitin-protein ligase XERICO [Coffea arabica]|uniref:Probable E3 ubiquitin-protein ligase XERICO n=1 Tax=Coffea arabica TaxID=13443 RepID=A0A6P6UGE2_COFAR|nr:probable E3 ubiquitin-protein ligase XERICO [Coffea arabica]XP_027089614.1 probable E3 ubiquitin-protein ligase XERICO [Coffea arabica]
MVACDHFVLCKAALIFGVTRWILSWARELVRSYLYIFSWSLEYDEPTLQSSSPIHPSSSGLEMVRNYLSLTTFETVAARLPQEESHNMSCAVCLKQLRKKNQVWELSNCRHIFHKECLDRWLVYDARLTCPLCRTSLISISTSELHSSMQQHQQQPSWAVERILYLFGDDMLCSSSYSP